MSDDLDLGRYIEFNYSHLMTALERRACTAMMMELKATNAHSPAMSRMLRKRSPANDSDVSDALKDGPAVFWRRVGERLVREHATEFVLARCSRCARLLRTPRARQCLACGLDWH
jgi:hypothetical protein